MVAGPRNGEDWQNWLEAEESGRDDAAEIAFARLLADLPAVEPTPDFVSRTVHAAWRARARRRLITRVARVAAVLLVSLLTVWSVYLFGVFIVGVAARRAALFA